MMWLLIATLSLAAWIYLAFARGSYWRARERLGPMPEPRRWPEVVAVIPARNEAGGVSAVIAAHQGSDYPGAFSVVLVDDASSDETVMLARAAAARGARRVEISAAPPLEAGWTGKLSAVNHGVARAKTLAPNATYLLLTDADIVHAAPTLRRLVAKAEFEDLALVSLMARLDARGIFGGLLIPAFIYFFQKLYPFARANDPASKVAVAAGGCMLVRRDALDAAGDLKAIKGRLIDDCALARLLKAPESPAPRRIWIGLADDEVVSLRDNRRLSSIWSMVARTAFEQLGRSWLKLAGAIIGMGIIYLAPPVILIGYFWRENAMAAAMAAASMSLMAYTYWPICRLYAQARWKTLLLPAAAFFYILMTISSAAAHWRGRGGRWKGRVYL